MIARNENFRITLSSFDLVKGLAMVLIIIGHATFHYDVQTLPLLKFWDRLTSAMGFMTAMFFMISGYSFKVKPVRKQLKTTFKQLIVPYMLVSLIYVLLYPITFYIAYRSWKYGFYETLLYLGAFLLGIPKPGKEILGLSLYHCSVLWFFLTFFIAANLMNLILKIKNKFAQCFLVVLCVIVGYVFILRDINYYCIPQGLMAIGCYYIGYLMKQHRFLERGMNCFLLYVILIPITLAHVIWGHFNLCLGEFNYGLLDYVCAICSGTLLMMISLYCDRLESNVLNWIKKVGIYTYWILCIHAVENGCMHWWAFAATIPSYNVAFIEEIVLKAIIIATGCFILKKIAQLRFRRRRNTGGK